MRLVSVCLLMCCISCSLAGRLSSKPTDGVVSHKSYENSKAYVGQISLQEKSSDLHFLDAPKGYFTEKNQKQMVLDKAYSMLGTRYRYGGLSSSGVDCSGLVLLSYKEADIILPHSSKQMSTYGKEVVLSEVEQGDLLFFAIQGKRISHVGIVVDVSDSVYFIHSSTKKGVIVSSLKESYWKKKYRKAVRIL